MHPTPSRAALAGRAIYFAAMGNGPMPPAVSFVEAIALERYGDKKGEAAAIERAVAALAESKDVVGEARAIAKSFFGDVPALPVTVAAPKRDVDPQAPAKANVPGNWDHDVEPVEKRKAAKSDDRRTIDEMERCGAVLVGAVRRRRELQDFGNRCSIDIYRDIVPKLRGKREAEANTLAGIADRLRQAALAAGVDARQPRPTPAGEQMMRAVATGATTQDVEVMMRAGAEYDAQLAAGAPLRCSRDNYVKHALRFKAGSGR